MVGASFAAWQWGAPPWVLAVGSAAMCAAIALGVDRYHSLGHLRCDGYLVSRWGSIVRRRVVLDETSVLGWGLRSTYFQRRLGLVTLLAATAAGRQAYQVRDIEPDTALGTIGEVTPDLLAQFRGDPAPVDAV
jgi:putative membrane protein